MRKQISELLGIELYDIYGLTEIYGPGIGINCKYDTGMHIWDDYVYIEIIDHETGKNVPDGEYGEIVLSTLVKEGAPLIRYRTHDIPYHPRRVSVWITLSEDRCHPSTKRRYGEVQGS